MKMYCGKRGLVRTWWSILLASIILLLYYWSILSAYNSIDFSFPIRLIWKQDLFMNLSDNYYWRALEKTRGSLLIDTPKCRLPYFDPFDRDVMSLIYSYTNPCEYNTKITYLENQKVMIDESEVSALGYSFPDISCCYRTIERVEQNLKHYDIDADNTIRYSDTCYPMNLTTEPVSGFIAVNCTAFATNGTKITIYQNFHALLKLSKAQQDRMYPKFAFWKKYAENLNNSRKFDQLTPPSVLILGLDTISRLHFHRTMRKSKELLEKIGAIDMMGYTKISRNTCPNLFSVLASYSWSLNDVHSICSDDRPIARAFDSYDFLWDHFSNQSYVTGYLDDAPWIGNFNMRKKGFVHVPTDLYLRPFMLAAYVKKNRTSCLGYQRPDDVLIKYTMDSLALLKEKKTPYFIITWWGQFTHNGPKTANGGFGLDGPFSEMIETLHKDGMLENTVLFVMGDHGFRSGRIQETTSGWFENNLPVMYIRLPESLDKQFPGWQEALEHNSKLLTSHYDTHETLKDILRLTSPNALSSVLPRGMGFFKKLPFRSCAEANISSSFCVCLPDYWEASLNTSVIRNCVEKVIDKINENLPRKCAEISATIVQAVTVMDKTGNGSVLFNAKYNIKFDALPKNLTIVAVVSYDHIAGNVREITSMIRHNRMTNQAEREQSFCLPNNGTYWENF